MIKSGIRGGRWGRGGGGRGWGAEEGVGRRERVLYFKMVDGWFFVQTHTGRRIDSFLKVKRWMAYVMYTMCINNLFIQTTSERLRRMGGGWGRGEGWKGWWWKGLHTKVVDEWSFVQTRVGRRLDSSLKIEGWMANVMYTRSALIIVFIQTTSERLKRTRAFSGELPSPLYRTFPTEQSAAPPAAFTEALQEQPQLPTSLLNSTF